MEGAMPSITVSENVLRRIRSQRRNAGETDDQILARLLALAESGRSDSDEDERLRAYEAADQDTRSTN